MPCYDHRDTEGAQDNAKAAAVLRALFKTNGLENTLAGVNFEGSGVTRKWIRLWWAKHLNRHAQREAEKGA